MSIPRFQAVTLTTLEFRWLHPEAWNDEQKARFLELRQAAAAGIHAPPAFMAPRRRVPPTTVGRWLLDIKTAADAKDEEHPQAQACVEAEVSITSFTTLYLHVSPCSAPDGWRGAVTQRALAFIVSGLMILTKADVVRILPLTPAVDADLANLGWGPAAPVAAFFVAGGAPSVQRVTTLVLDPHAWRETPHGKVAHQSLAYLEKRVQHGEAKAKPSRVQRPGLMLLLSKLLRWG